MSAFGALQQASLDGAARQAHERAAPEPAEPSSFDDLVTFIDSLLDAVVLVREDTLQIAAANQEAVSILGIPHSQLIGRSVFELAATPEDVYYWADPVEQRDGELLSDSLVVREDGEVVQVTRRVRRVQLSHEVIFLVSFRDRSGEHRAEMQLEKIVAELAATLESTADALLATDLSGRIRGFNRHFAALWNLPEELTQQRRDDAEIEVCMERLLVDPAAYRERLQVLRREAEERISESAPPEIDVLHLTDGRVLERVAVPQRSRGVVTGRVFSFRDITERLAAQQRIETLSHTDTLTGLPNRRSLGERMEHALAVGQRDGSTFAVMFLDLDRFKHINDTFGHAFGDRVLVETTKRLQSALRQVDTVARQSGDEFVVIIHEADVAGAEAAARRIMEAMAVPFALDDINFTVTCSIGVAMYPADGKDTEELFRSADMAMYQVKTLGRSGYRFYLPGKEVDMRTRVKLDHAMRQALAASHFALHYQPQIDLKTGAIVGAEALMRWKDPVLGEVPPHEFFALAEESGFIVSLCDWALGEAVKQAARWHQAGEPIRVAVNIAALQFHRSNFVADVAAALQRSGLPPELLELELTESILRQDADEALNRLQQLAALGVMLSIDDFGTGYSSLAYLKRFPVQRLKIDSSFVMGLPGGESDGGIVRAIIDLARSFKLKVIAEGVETEAQRQFLLDAGCDDYQGFLYAPALRVADFHALRHTT